MHEEPARRTSANLVIAGFLGEQDGRRRWEQLYARRLSAETAEICCIPYFVRDLSLADWVRFDRDYMITDVISLSGFVTFQIWFGQPYHTPNDIRDRVVEQVIANGGEHEHLGSERLAVAVPTEDAGRALSGYLLSLQEARLLAYQTGRS
jgi:hypothetical protein